MERSVYVRPIKNRALATTQAVSVKTHVPVVTPPLLAVDKATECHVTPLPVGARMVSYLGDISNCIVCEPQAGTGNLIQALIEAGHPLDLIVAIERHYQLCESIRTRFEPLGGFSPINSCFLEYSREQQENTTFKKIITNPPFRFIKQHMEAAIGLLAVGGDLIALVPNTYQHPDASELEELDGNTFSTTKVHTKIIHIGK